MRRKIPWFLAFLLALPAASPAAEIGQLTSEINRINGQIASERDRIRTARDRKRSARSFYVARKLEWQKLTAERNRVAGEIRSIDRKVQELEKGR